MKSIKALLIVAFLFAGCVSTHQIAVQHPERIVFLGDSITELGGQPTGYVTLVADALKEKYGPKAPEVINAGVSGNKVTDLQLRLERDVLSKNPTVVVIYIGINDVWHFSMPGLKGTSKEDYESGLRDIISRCHAAGAKVILCTPSVIGEKANGENPQDQMLNEYAEISRKVARDTGTRLCDLHRLFIEYLMQHNPKDEHEGILTVDGVHLTDDGNRFVSGIMLKALGY
ncbi:MAG: SGNH/GDSL hydrolase family protein [Candidatus Kryptoniota bacterium]